MQEKQPAGLEHSVSLGDVANCDVKSRSRENLAGENCDGKFPRPGDWSENSVQMEFAELQSCSDATRWSANLRPFSSLESFTWNLSNS